MDNKWLLLYFSEDERILAEGIRKEIQYRQIIKCEVRNCSYLGYLEGYSNRAIVSFDDAGRSKILKMIMHNYPAPIGTLKFFHIYTHEKNDFLRRNPSKTHDDYIEYLSKRSADALL